MKNIDLINYLSQFSDDSELRVIVANPDKDVSELYSVKDFFSQTKKLIAILVLLSELGKLNHQEMSRKRIGFIAYYLQIGGAGRATGRRIQAGNANVCRPCRVEFYKVV